eukprot:4232693-Pleurochrysis_carterae.AAC.1
MAFVGVEGGHLLAPHLPDLMRKQSFANHVSEFKPYIAETYLDEVTGPLNAERTCGRCEHCVGDGRPRSKVLWLTRKRMRDA